MIKVLVADDNDIMRRGLRLALRTDTEPPAPAVEPTSETTTEPSVERATHPTAFAAGTPLTGGPRSRDGAGGPIEVVAEARTGIQAVDLARRLLPDVVLMDIRMPGKDGIEATREILLLPSPPAVLVLTVFDRDEYIEQVLRAGAAGFLLKDIPPAELVRAVRMVHAGHTMLDPTVVRRALDLMAAPPSDAGAAERRAVARLTPREVEVLRLVAAGLSNSAIGAELHTTESTVKGHVSRVMTKLGADNRVQIARIAYRAGLDEDDAAP
ncbi:response regulator transcription factor [Streptomyces sp. NPDC097619]|uniref:response regulator transcription factor n=1 Tax=Streptomyces sp. NPDC097619 TaxID=3157228 RepID=UPI003325CC69